ncbi:MAG: tRNA pseudouridine(55) synthase TruB [Endomicrobiaceae bacterium]|nr:tRNA pseudouridine(55) synthase TruB [Endomicrobiaceae bacterium]MDD3730223.1 tRNA pseudouridine(55) synthase TruB [Endomicrobiaceae bacterium]MDD4166418.1 tRNA pseudouridine(55) synthase TruB [Endomicrobiaceae bacterium]
MQNDYSGLLLVNKPSGITSFKLVNLIKKKLQVKKAGHCGTLDPLASGLMLVLIGKATKLQDKFMKQDKVYTASVKLGTKTDSGDLAGKVVQQSDYSHVDIDKIKNVCKDFIGETEQIPPMFSALKVGGKKLYELARKGIEIERKRRKITIYFIDVIDYSDGIIKIRVKCSSGTYIRTLAEDIGKKLKTDAVLNNLVREEIGDYSLAEAVALDEIVSHEPEFTSSKIIVV